MREIHWKKSIVDSVKLRLMRGVPPQDIKESFSALVDRLIPPEEELRLAKLEIKKLKQKLYGKFPKEVKSDAEITKAEK